MAIGDAGAAKGLTIYPATQPHSLGYQNDNQRADDIANEIDARFAGDVSLSGRLDVVAADTGWVSPTLATGWTSYTPGTWGAIAYRIKNGIIYLRGVGLVGSGATPTVFTLPVGARPLTAVQLLIIGNLSGGGGNTGAGLSISTAGTVTVSATVFGAGQTYVFGGLSATLD